MACSGVNLQYKIVSGFLGIPLAEAGAVGSEDSMSAAVHSVSSLPSGIKTVSGVGFRDTKWGKLTKRPHLMQPRRGILLIIDQKRMHRSQCINHRLRGFQPAELIVAALSWWHMANMRE